jgi:aminopeptidase N
MCGRCARTNSPKTRDRLAHPVRPRRYREINNFYTATVYEKGAEVVRMIRTILGADGFRRGMDLYFERHDGDAATIEDFLKCFEDATGRDLNQFAIWYQQAGTPNVSVSTSFDRADGRHSRSTLSNRFRRRRAKCAKSSCTSRWHLRCSGLTGAILVAIQADDKSAVDGQLIHLTRRRHIVRFRGLSERPAVSINRGFSAPVSRLRSISQPRSACFWHATTATCSAAGRR